MVVQVTENNKLVHCKEKLTEGIINELIEYVTRNNVTNLEFIECQVESEYIEMILDGERIKSLSIIENHASKQFGKAIFTKIANCSSLKNLQMKKCGVINSHARILFGSKSITSIDLTNNFITDKAIIGLNNKTLKCLNLSKNKITYNGIKTILNNTEVTDLILEEYNKAFGEKTIKLLAKSSKLKSLNLANNKLTDRNIAPLCYSKSIEHLNLANNRFLYYCCDVLRNNNTITTLNLCGVYGIGQYLNKLLQMSNLVNLTIANCEILDEHLKNFNELSKIEVLDISCNKIGATGFESLMQNKILKQLDITANHCINSKHLKTYMYYNTSLISLFYDYDNYSPETQEVIETQLNFNKKWLCYVVHNDHYIPDIGMIVYDYYMCNF